MKRILIASFAVLALSACTDAERAKLGSYGSETTVECYSAGVKVFEDRSTGKVMTGEAGIAFKSKATGEYIITYADCIVRQQ